MAFNNLIVYSDYSVHIGYGTIDEYINVCKEKGINALALTDANSMMGIYKFLTKCKANNIKSIIGVTLTIESHNVTFLAKNLQGYHELCKLLMLSTKNNIDEPYLTIDNLHTTNNIIAIIHTYEKEPSVEFIKSIKAKISSTYLEFTPLPGNRGHIKQSTIGLAECTGTPLLMCSPTFYAYSKDKEMAEINMALSKNYSMSETPVTKGGLRPALYSDEHYLKSSDEFLSYVSQNVDVLEEVIATAVNNTQAVVDSIEQVELEYQLGLRPVPHIPAPYTDNLSYFKALIQEGWNKFVTNKPKKVQLEWKRRIQNELEVIHSNDFIDYFLVVREYIKWSEDNGYPTGCGRGSAGGSCIARLLGIHKTDPVRYDLMFDRFLSPGRSAIARITYNDDSFEEVPVSTVKNINNEDNYTYTIKLGDTVDGKTVAGYKIVDIGAAPDVDTDFEPEVRPLVFQHCQEEYGENNITHIITRMPYGARNAFKCVARVYDISPQEANSISELLPEAVSKDTLKDVLDESNATYESARLKLNTRLLNLVKKASELEGRTSGTGIHACFTKEALVLTSKGYKYINEVKVGDYVLTHKNRFKQVAKVIVTENKKGYKLFTSNSLPLVVTENHPFYVIGLEDSQPKWKDAKDIKPMEDYIGVPLDYEINEPLPDYDLPYDKKDFWWLVGRFVGDGWIEDNVTNKNRVRADGTHYVKQFKVNNIVISVGKQDKTYQELISKVGSLFHFRVNNGGTADKVYISNQQFFEFLKSFDKGASNKKIPMFVFSLDIEFQKQFISGYLSADGSIKANGRQCFSTVSKKLALGMMILINKVYHVHCCAYEEQRDLMKIEGRTVHCKNRYCVAFNKESTRKPRYAFIKDGYIWEKVKLKEDLIITEPTYNLSVYDDNSYTVNNLTVHNCGVLISCKEISDTVPTIYKEDPRNKDMIYQVSMFEYPEAEALGLIKMDFLGLDTLHLISSTVKLVEQYTGTKLNMNEIIDGPLDDKRTYQMFQKGKTSGIFQFAEPGVREMLTKVKPTKFEELAAITAIYRPGPMSLGLHDDFAIRKNDPSKRIPFSKEFIGTPIDTLTKDTFGAIVYQEQVMKIAQEAAGFTSKEADKMRKAMGKKKIEILNMLEPKFKEGIIRNTHCSQSTIDELWSQLLGFAQYAFNSSHAVSYALNSYQSAYLKVHYPVLWATAALRMYADNPDKVTKYVEDTKSNNIKILPPDINESELLISPTSDLKSITYSISNIRRIPVSTLELFIKEREANGKYTDLMDFIKRNKDNLSVSVLQVLACSGCLDCFHHTRKSIYDNAEKLLKSVDKKKSNVASMFSMIGEDVGQAVELGNEEWPTLEKMANEGNALGAYLSGNPLDGLKTQDGQDVNQTKNLKNCDTDQYITFLSVAQKKTRSGKTLIIGMANNGASQVEIRLPSSVTDRILLNMALKRTNGDRAEAYKLMRLSDDKIKSFDKMEPLEKPVKFSKIYKLSFGRGFRGGTMITNIEPVEVSVNNQVLDKITVSQDKTRNFAKFQKKVAEETERAKMSKAKLVDILIEYYSENDNEWKTTEMDNVYISASTLKLIK